MLQYLREFNFASVCVRLVLAAIVGGIIGFGRSRFSAAVISGIGFLAAGSIMLIAHQQISGLTTAIGLFITACIGIAVGAGFYEAVIFAAVFIVLITGSYRLKKLS